MQKAVVRDLVQQPFVFIKLKIFEFFAVNPAKENRCHSKRYQLCNRERPPNCMKTKDFGENIGRW